MFTRLPTKQRHPERGGAAVEFALIMPIFVAIVFGMIDYGWYFYQKYTLAAAIREGVRYGVTFKDDPVAGEFPYTEALNEAAARCDLKSVPSSAVTWSGGVATMTVTGLGATPIKKLTLQGQFHYTPLVGLVPMPNATVTYSVTMLLEKPFN